MARRRKNDDLFWAEAAAGITTLLVGFSILIPGFRYAVLGFGLIALSVIVLFAIGFVAFKIVKAKGVSTGNSTMAFFTASAPAGKSTPKPSSRPMPFVLPSDFVRYSAPEIKPIEQLRKIDWYQFEKFIAYIYEKRGFDVTRKGGANPDGGVDLIVYKDGQRFAVQCKQWKTWKVGVKPMREFLGALTDSGIQKGIFIALNKYSDDAKQLAEKHRIEIINETGLRRMMDGLDMRDPKILEIFNDTRKICPKCEREMVLRTARQGPNVGGQFWGCSGFSRGCRFTMPV
jgi:HJR/Mrr/RecB family endonuclease